MKTLSWARKVRGSVKQNVRRDMRTSQVFTIYMGRCFLWWFKV